METDNSVGLFCRVAWPQTWLRARPRASPQQPRLCTPRGLLGNASLCHEEHADRFRLQCECASVASGGTCKGYTLVVVVVYMGGCFVVGDDSQGAKSTCESMCE